MASPLVKCTTIGGHLHGSVQQQPLQKLQGFSYDRQNRTESIANQLQSDGTKSEPVVHMIILQNPTDNRFWFWSRVNVMRKFPAMYKRVDPVYFPYIYTLPRDVLKTKNKLILKTKLPRIDSGPSHPLKSRVTPVI